MANATSDLVPGSLLVAAPIMEDPNFRRTVVLLCDHTTEGSFGLVLNRPTDLHLGDVMDAYFVNDPPLGMGGPVQQETLHFLHRYADTVPESVQVIPGVRWGGAYDTIETLVQNESPTPSTIRFFLGYTGWAPGQLKQEVNQGGWVVTDARPEWVFDTAPASLWSTVMRAMGGEYALLSTFPDDPRMN